MCHLSLHSGLCTVGAGFQGVRGTNRHIQRRVGVAQGRGEDIGGSQVRAGDESRYLHLRGVVALQCSSVDEGGDGIVLASSLT